MTEQNESQNGTSQTGGRGRILAGAGKLEERPAQLPGPDGPVDVLVRELTGKQARLFEEAVQKGASAPLGYLLQMCLVDPETHELLFEPADREAIEALSVKALRPIIAMCQELNGLSDADVAKAKDSLLRGPSSG